MLNYILLSKIYLEYQMKELTVMTAHVEQGIHPSSQPSSSQPVAKPGRKLLGDLKRTISHRIMNNAPEEHAWRALMKHHGFIQPVELIRYLVKIEFTKLCTVNDYIDKVLNNEHPKEQPHE